VEIAALVAFAALLSAPATAQQRPLATEDPEPVGAGRLLIESGIDVVHDQQYPVSGLKGDLLRFPTIGLSFGISSIAEFQIDGDFYSRLNISRRNPLAPFAAAVADGDSSRGVDDAVIATKIRLLSETTGRPAIGIRFATKLPNASNGSGLDLNTTDFFISILGGKTVQSVRVVGNIGVGILGDPTDGARQNDDLTYGLSFARAVTQQVEMVSELNGRVSTRSGTAFPGTESRGMLKLGGRFTAGMLRLDAGVFFGLTTVDPTIGFTTGLTLVFNAFRVP
jgi:hypothetical protein